MEHSIDEAVAAQGSNRVAFQAEQVDSDGRPNRKINWSAAGMEQIPGLSVHRHSAAAERVMPDERVMPEFQSTVLLVEDEPLVRLFVADLLEEAGFKVVEAANTTEAWVLLEAGLEVNVLLTDVDMPNGCNGFELAQKVHEFLPQAEILIMSGRQWPYEGDLPQGAAFLAKPCPHETIVSYVHSAAERSRRYLGPAARHPVHQETAKILSFPKTA